MRVDIDSQGWLRFPDPFNVAQWLIDRHAGEGRGGKPAIRTRDRTITYFELREAVDRTGNALAALGLGPGDRLLMVVSDCPEWVFLFWGAIKAGIVPVPLNTLLRAADYDFIIADSQCAGIVHSPEYAGEVSAALAQCPWHPKAALSVGAMTALAAAAAPVLAARPAHADDDCFWLYSSGTTGQPKGVVHRHRDIPVTCHNYGIETLGAVEGDVFYSVPKLFFSYGMGVAMTFPLWVGGTALLDERRCTPQTVAEMFRFGAPTIFAGVPTFFAALLAAGVLSRADTAGLRRCICGGEATPPELMRRWEALTGVPITEGIGSTEVLHIYIGTRMGDIRPGATGKPVTGYQVRIVDEHGRDQPDGTPGRLLVRGQSLARCYWNNPEKTAKAMAGGWLDSGDTYRRDHDGFYVYCGRSDDMLKVGARWVSPFEIEAALIEHPRVLEAAVVGRADEVGLVGAEAWVVLTEPADDETGLAEDIRGFCKTRLAPYKYPRWIHFIDTLPKTATGKIQRYKLRSSQQDG